MKAWTIERNAYWYRPSPNMRRIYLGNTRLEAIEAMRRIRAGEIEPQPLLEYGSAGGWRRILGQLYFSMRKRAVRKGLAYMAREELGALWSRAGGHCELTGIPFSLEPLAERRARPWAPSLDRIECGGDYRFENCRLVCTAINVAMNQWGLDVLRKLVLAAAANNGAIVEGLGKDSPRGSQAPD